MPISTKADYLNVLQALVAFAEGETLTIPVPIFQVGEGLLVPNYRTNDQIVTATRRQREVIQLELRHFLRGIAKGHGHMITPMQIRIEVTVTPHPPDPPGPKRRHRRDRRVASYLVEGSARDWVFSLVDRVLPHVAIEVLQPCPGCERAFVKVTRKRFCSPRCQSRSYMREWRAEQE